MQLLSQVLRGVKAMHEEGFAHCNIKPSNILRRLRQHDWILADMACVARVGTGPTLYLLLATHMCLHSARLLYVICAGHAWLALAHIAHFSVDKGELFIKTAVS